MALWTLPFRQWRFFCSIPLLPWRKAISQHSSVRSPASIPLSREVGSVQNSRKWQLFLRSRRNCSYKRPMGAARKASWIYRTSKGTKRYLPYTLKPSRRGKIAQMCPGGRGKATLQPYRPVYKERIFVIRGMDVAGSCCIHYWPTDYILFSRLLRPLFLLRFALCPNETRGKNMEASVWNSTEDMLRRRQCELTKALF